MDYKIWDFAILNFAGFPYETLWLDHRHAVVVIELKAEAAVDTLDLARQVRRLALWRQLAVAPPLEEARCVETEPVARRASISRAHERAGRPLEHGGTRRVIGHLGGERRGHSGELGGVHNLSSFLLRKRLHCSPVNQALNFKHTQTAHNGKANALRKCKICLELLSNLGKASDEEK